MTTETISERSEMESRFPAATEETETETECPFGALEKRSMGWHAARCRRSVVRYRKQFGTLEDVVESLLYAARRERDETLRASLDHADETEWDLRWPIWDRMKAHRRQASEYYRRAWEIICIEHLPMALVKGTQRAIAPENLVPALALALGGLGR